MKKLSPQTTPHPYDVDAVRRRLVRFIGNGPAPSSFYDSDFAQRILEARIEQGIDYTKRVPAASQVSPAGVR